MSDETDGDRAGELCLAIKVPVNCGEFYAELW